MVGRVNLDKGRLQIIGLMDKISGLYSQHELKRIYPIVDRIEALEPEMKALSDAELQRIRQEFKERLKEGETLDDILPEAYAVMRRYIEVWGCAITGYS